MKPSCSSCAHAFREEWSCDALKLWSAELLEERN